MGNYTIVVEAKCKGNSETFYITYHKGADGVWVLARGEKEIDNNQKSESATASIDLTRIRMSPKYSCPHCGNKNFIKCASCRKITCYDGQSPKGYCAYCSMELELQGIIKSMEGDSAKGQ